MKATSGVFWLDIVAGDVKVELTTHGNDPAKAKILAEVVRCINRSAKGEKALATLKRIKAAVNSPLLSEDTEKACLRGVQRECKAKL